MCVYTGGVVNLKEELFVFSILKCISWASYIIRFLGSADYELDLSALSAIYVISAIYVTSVMFVICGSYLIHVFNGIYVINVIYVIYDIYVIYVT